MTRGQSLEYEQRVVEEKRVILVQKKGIEKNCQLTVRPFKNYSFKLLKLYYECTNKYINNLPRM